MCYVVYFWHPLASGESNIRSLIYLQQQKTHFKYFLIFIFSSITTNYVKEY